MQRKVNINTLPRNLLKEEEIPYRQQSISKENQLSWPHGGKRLLAVVLTGKLKQHPQSNFRQRTPFVRGHFIVMGCFPFPRTDRSDQLL